MTAKQPIQGKGRPGEGPNEGTGGGNGALGTDARAVRLGSDLRALRKSRGMTLSALASSVGRSVGYLSQVERGLSELSLADLRAVVDVLGVPISWLFAHEGVPEEERGFVVRSQSRRRIGTPEGGLVEELLSPDLGGGFEMVRSVFEPGAELADFERRDTEEAGYVVSGRLDLWIDDRFFSLSPGDSFRFARQSYRWRNPGDDRAVVIWVISPPVY